MAVMFLAALVLLAPASVQIGVAAYSTPPFVNDCVAKRCAFISRVGFGGAPNPSRIRAGPTDDDLGWRGTPKNSVAPRRMSPAEEGESSGSSRRDVLILASRSLAASGAASVSAAAPSTAPARAAAAEPTPGRPSSPQPLSASWSATQGLNSLSSETNPDSFVAFDPSAYAAMRDDKSRTPQFRRAVQRRLDAAPGGPGSVSVLDLGTGPYALLAIIAAEAGAGKVYAVEANPAAAKSAREAVDRAGFGSVVTILEGFSTDVVLPEKVDLVLAEIVGSVATEEGAYATVLDAHRRFVKEPTDPASWIPNRIQTYAAPASYLLHGLMGPPEFDWSKLGGEPVRFNCRDEGLQLLADPVLVEDVKFYDVGGGERKAASGPTVGREKVEFVIDPERIEDNEVGFYVEVKRASQSGGAPMTDSAARSVAQTAARSVTGIALWPRLVLDGTTVVASRKYPSGDHQRSHWQTVLPIMCDRPVQGVMGGDRVVVDVDFDFVTEKVDRAPRYKMKGEVIPTTS